MKQLAIPLCVAMGLTYVIMIGSIDLSINGVVGMTGSLAGVFVANEVNKPCYNHYIIDRRLSMERRTKANYLPTVAK